MKGTTDDSTIAVAQQRFSRSVSGHIVGNRDSCFELYKLIIVTEYFETVELLDKNLREIDDEKYACDEDDDEGAQSRGRFWVLRSLKKVLWNIARSEN